MKLQMTSKDNVRSLFGTPLASFRMPQADQLNPTLLSWLRQMEREEGADVDPPLNGWHADLDLTASSRPDLLEVADTMRHAVFSMLGIMTGLERFEAQLELTVRASIYRARSHSHAALHPGSTWSGLYFIQAAQLDREPSAEAGQISFHDPRTRAGMLAPPGNRYRDTSELRPSDGLMVVYPSWLACHLNGFVSDTSLCLLTFRSRVRKFRVAQ